MRILVVAAHPDDEVLGCGATYAKHAANGDEVFVVILAEGITSRQGKRDRESAAEELTTLGKAAKKANDILGVKSLTLHSFPDNRMDSVDLLDVVKVVEEHVKEVQPAIVFTHHIGDVNVDHDVTHRAVVTACRPQGGQSVDHLLYFEVASSTEWQTPEAGRVFSPNCFVDVEETLPLKLRALEAYSSEMRDWPHPRSIRAVEHLARWRGVTIETEAAEAFIIGRSIARQKKTFGN
jgi:LmbE family N-acetylglucosaminyl deacetylase